MKKAADILKHILGEREAERAGEWSSFFTGWQALAGDDIAAHSTVKDVKQGAVIVEVDHPGWLQLLQMRKSEILGRIKKKYPELDIRDIRIFLGASPSREIPTRTERIRQHSPPETKEIENTEEYREFKKMLQRLKKRN